MTRRTLAALVAAAAVVTTSAAAYADPQDVCVGFKDNPAYCVGSEDGLIELPPIGTGRIGEIIRNG